jgi:hypothetical protein
MPIVMRCPGCKTQFEFTDNLEGKRIKCKTCGDIFRADRPSARATAREDDDRPAVRSGSRRFDDEADDRPSARRRVDDDDDRPVSRYRRPIEEDDERQRSRRRQPDDDDDRNDDRPRRRRDEDDDYDRPKKKVHPLLIVGPIAALVLIVAVGVVIYLSTKGKKKGGPDGEAGGDLVKAPVISCPLELPEKDLGILVLPDGGNMFGFLRKKDDKPAAFQKNWTFDMYDMSAGRRLGRIDLSDLDEPRCVSLSPDGKMLMVMEGPAFGPTAPTIRLWSVPDNKPITAQKWNPYPPPAKAVFDPPSLYRAEFVSSGKLITLSSARFVDVWPLPTFDPKVVDGISIPSKGDHLGKDDRFGNNSLDKFQRQSAFSADHKLLAVWTGSRIAVVGAADGVEVFGTGSLVEQAKEWRWKPPEQIKVGAMAFSPDGKILAAMIHHDSGEKNRVIGLWDITAKKDPDFINVRINQLNDAPAMCWWGNRYIVTQGAKVEGMLIDVLTKLPKRQLMGPRYGKYGFGRDGRLWYAVSDELKSPATMYVIDGIDADRLIEPDDYEQIVELRNDFFMRRLWMEKTGIMRQQADPDPSLRQQRLIRQP